MTAAGKATIYDIARHAKVGIATVSRVLNGSSRVAEPTRLAVRRAVEELGWRPSRAARRLAARGAERPRLAALMPLFSATFYHAVSRPLAGGLAAAGIDLAIYDVSDREVKNRLLDRLLAERACELLMLCSMRIGPERVAQLRSLAVPTIFVDLAQDGFPSVSVDNREGAMLQYRFLKSRGCKRIAYVGGPAEGHAYHDREAGFRAIAGPDALIELAGAMTVAEGRAACSRLLARDRRIDGVVCVNDFPAIGVVEELRARKRRVPQDVQVIGFDDQPLMDVFGLTTVHQPLPEFGDWALNAICRLAVEPAALVASARLDLTIIERGTTRLA
jgi:DNA-binding LacI/PurR family transcriptional regulator